METNIVLASIDQTLASARAALAVGADPEQGDGIRAELGGRAGADIARLVASSRGEDWGQVPRSVRDAIERAGAAAGRGDLRAAEDALTSAREQIGGPSR
jgi:hypothetical protein